MLLGHCFLSNAQSEGDSPVKKEKKTLEPGSQELAFGINFNTNASLLGGIEIKYALKYKPKTFHNFSVEIVNVKHNKEERFSSAISGKSFIRGKVNYLISIRPRYGREIVLFDKFPENGVRLSAIFAGGPSIGLVKPYFIEYALSPSDTSAVVVVPFDPVEHHDGLIVGGGGFFNGFDQAKVRVGLNIKAALNFEFGRNETSLAGIETGFTIEAYNRKIDLFSSYDDQAIFGALFFTLYYGSRY